MSDAWTCEPVSAPFNATVDPPGSKSLTNRALILAALANGPCRLTNVLIADDTVVMLDALRQLGLKLKVDQSAKTVEVDAPASHDFATRDANLFCGNSGTTLRFLTALLAAVGDAVFTLDGIQRMRERPAGPLAGLLNDLAGNNRSPVTFIDKPGLPPIRVEGTNLAGGTITYPAGETLSSQFLSAVVMVAPYTRHETRIDLNGRQLSWPYVKMTMRLMDRFDVTPEVEIDEKTEAPLAIIVPRGRYAGTDYTIEPDASAAGYFLGLAAIHPGSRITIRGLDKTSLQGDSAFVNVLARMGCEVEQAQATTALIGPASLNAIDVDLADMPDCAQTLAVVALFAAGDTTIRGLKTLRVKETDRVAALENELTKLGAEVHVREHEGDVSMTISPPARVRSASIKTYDDHRMAMSFALAATKRRGIEIEDPGCVSKTYPHYFADLARVLQ